MSAGQRLKDHFSDSWPMWLVSIGIVFAVFIMYDARVSIERLDTKVGTQDDRMKELRTDTQENTSVNHRQDLEINENRIRLDMLQKNVSLQPNTASKAQSDDAANNRDPQLPR